jgi:phosphopantothenoylcysteine decarboxylase/phosphopantothenate--cysteine ligase
LPSIELVENPDILAGLRAVAPGSVLVGFAAETNDLERNARAKLERKGADFLVANDVSRSDIAFGSGDNEVTVYRREGDPIFLPRRPKGELAASLFDLFAATLSRSEHLSAASPL